MFEWSIWLASVVLLSVCVTIGVYLYFGKKSSSSSKPSKDTVLHGFFALAGIVGIVLLYQVDLIVHSRLYEYGLRFDYGWANDYWLFFRAFTMVFIAVLVAHPILAYRNSRLVQRQVAVSNVRNDVPKPVQPRTQLTGEPATFSRAKKYAKEAEAVAAGDPGSNPGTVEESEVESEEVEPEAEAHGTLPPSMEEIWRNEKPVD